jgi:hypothetical protein
VEIKAATDQHGVELRVNPDGFQTYDASLPSSSTVRPFLALIDLTKEIGGGLQVR